MNEINLPSLSKILKSGALGGLKFVEIVRHLYEAEERKRSDFRVKNFDDCRGDVDGADVFIHQGLRNIRIQVKFYPSPLSAQQRSTIKAEYLKHKSANEYDEWYLLTPDDLHASDFQWFKATFGENCTHKGHSYLSNMLIEHLHIAQRVYPNHDFSNVIRLRTVPVNPESFFAKFLDADADIERLFARAQPTHSDCKEIFTDEWSELMFDVFTEFYRDTQSFGLERDRILTYSEVSVESAKWADYKTKGHGKFPGGMKDMINIIRDSVTFYFITYHSGDHKGRTYGGWIYLNGRWVFLGKVFRIWRTALSVRNNDDLKFFLKALKPFNLKKRFKDTSPQYLRLLAGQLIREVKK